MEILNLVLSVMSVLGGFLVLKAFFRNINWGNFSSVDFLIASISLILVCIMVRTSYWDIFWPLSGGKISNPLFNSTINFLILVSQFSALKAKYMMIPQEEQKDYNIFTSVWYPRGIRLRPKDK